MGATAVGIQDKLSTTSGRRNKMKTFACRLLWPTSELLVRARDTYTFIPSGANTRENEHKRLHKLPTWLYSARVLFYQKV